MSHRVALRQGDVAAAPSLFPRESFDVVLLHHVLEYTDDPGLVLRGAAQVLRRERTAILSVVARNRMGAVLGAAIHSGDPAAVERALTAATTDEPICGGRARLFTIPELRTLLAEASLTTVAERGVRIVFDYLAPFGGDNAGDRVAALEHVLGAITEFSAVARYAQMLARRK
jgi:SAM-dependent methyltransferase